MKSNIYPQYSSKANLKSLSGNSYIFISFSIIVNVFNTSFLLIECFNQFHHHTLVPSILTIAIMFDHTLTLLQAS